MEWLSNIFSEFCEYSFIIFLFVLTSIIGSLIMGKMLFSSLKFDSKSKEQELKLKNLSKLYEDTRDKLLEVILPSEELKKIAKNKKVEEKKNKKLAKKNNTLSNSDDKKNRLFVLNFDGDVQASQVKQLSKEITALLSIIEPNDEVVIKLNSPGGVVHGYGLGAAQIARIRNSGVNVTVCIDKIAASGGYMMACIANKIVSAPFAIVGSIGVVAEFPNFNRLLKKFDIDYEQETAGEYKRTLSMLGDNSNPKAREKFKQDLEECHTLFKNHVSKYRQNLDINTIATGEHWFAIDAVKLHLVDEIMTSDEYIVSKLEKMEIYEFVQEEPKKTLISKFMGSVENYLFKRSNSL